MAASPPRRRRPPPPPGRRRRRRGGAPPPPPPPDDAALRRLIRRCSRPRRSLVRRADGVPCGADEPTAVQIVTADVGLPTGDVFGLPGVTTERAATAYVVVRADKWDARDGSGAKAVVFGHGFSQKPRNTQSTLRTLAAAGLAVIAPAVWFPNTAPPWVPIATARWSSSPPARLQTALAIDMLRAAGLAAAVGARRVSLVGHSMGGALALVVGGHLLAAARASASASASAAAADGSGGGGARLTVDSIAALAPAAGPLAQTAVNPLLSLDARGGAASAVDFFRGWGGAGGGAAADADGGVRPPATLLVSAPRDRIVRPSSVGALLDAARTSGAVPRAAHVTLAGGAHTGFEDSLRVDLRLLPLVDTLAFGVLDVLVYRLDVFEVWTGDFDAQLRVTKRLLVDWLTGDAQGDRRLYEVPPEGGSIDAIYL